MGVCTLYSFIACMLQSVNRISLMFGGRFKYEGIWRDKITAHVDFPAVDQLDMSRYISGPKQRAPYNLFAVSVCLPCCSTSSHCSSNKVLGVGNCIVYRQRFNGMAQGFTSHSTQNRSFQRRFSQPVS